MTGGDVIVGLICLYVFVVIAMAFSGASMSRVLQVYHATSWFCLMAGSVYFRAAWEWFPILSICCFLGWFSHWADWRAKGLL